MIHQVIYMNDFKVLRAEKTWQRAGAYSVRIQGMNRQHHIALQDEFDEHDGDESKYIVLLDDSGSKNSDIIKSGSIAVLKLSAFMKSSAIPVWMTR